MAAESQKSIEYLAAIDKRDGSSLCEAGKVINHWDSLLILGEHEPGEVGRQSGRSGKPQEGPT